MITSVLVVDDHELFRQGVVATRLPEPDFDVVGEAATAAEALARANRLRPNVILLDVSLPDGSGLVLLPTLIQTLPDTRVVMLTVSEDQETVTDALRCGAAGYLVKGVHAGELLEALRAILRGETYVSPAVAGRILAALNRPLPDAATPVTGIDALTRREREVLDLLARGETNREIADALVLSEKTVKRHVTGILSKLQARNRTEAALRARSHADGPRT